jgi:hypothetical protein
MVNKDPEFRRVQSAVIDAAGAFCRPRILWFSAVREMGRERNFPKSCNISALLASYLIENNILRVVRLHFWDMADVTKLVFGVCCFPSKSPALL